MNTIYDAKILIVDDNADLLALLCEQLHGAGYGKIRTAQSCGGARAAFAAGQPELMILDINLPDGDGFSLFRALRAKADVPALFLSARDADADRLFGLGLGADDYLTKPFLMQELLLRVQHILQRAYRAELSAAKPTVLQLGPRSVDLNDAVVSLPDGKTLALTATELALLRYRLPRLQGMGESLSRQGGGGGGGGARRGAGETKLELDRRHVHARIDALAEKLAEMEKRRGESRKARAKTGMPVVSLVGYTNVGKSSLMNALCGPSVAEADMLFATLDPTSRKLVLPSGMAVLLVDTVGFVSRLPHNLVEAFKSTLEEAAWSDVIVRVADAGDEQREEQLAVTDEVLDGLDCADIPRLTVYNKCDKPGALSFDPDILLTSAKTGYGLDKLLAKLDETLSDRVHTIRVLLPYDKLGLAAPMRERGSVQLEEYREDGLYLEGIVKTEDLHCFEGYLV